MVISLQVLRRVVSVLIQERIFEAHRVFVSIEIVTVVIVSIAVFIVRVVIVVGSILLVRVFLLVLNRLYWNRLLLVTNIRNRFKITFIRILSLLNALASIIVWAEKVVTVKVSDQIGICVGAGVVWVNVGILVLRLIS